MQKITGFLGKYKKYLIGVVVLAILAFVFLGKNEIRNQNFYIVETQNIEQSVVLSGKVETTAKADLGFAASGRINKIFVKNNQKVSQGQTLAQLEIGDLLADLKIKQLNSNTTGVDIEDAKAEVEKVTKQEDAKVKNAYRNLLTEGLELVADSNTYNVEPPFVSGIYDGKEGVYKVNIGKESVTDTDLTIRTFNLEKTERIINEQGSTLLGSFGLYISFPDDDLDLYDDTTWYLTIPNKSSSSYLSNFNAYIEAKNTRDLNIKNAEFAYQKLLSADDGISSVDQAEIQKINAEIRKNTIYAPFAGRVTNIEKEVGENASVGERVVSIIGEDKLQIVLQVSELDVSKLVTGVNIEISLDAFPNEVFNGVLTTINSKETKIDGVPVYEAFVELASDTRIKTGMSASGMVILAFRDQVLAIPNYLIEKDGDKNFVQVLTIDEKTEKREVSLGLTGSDSMVEVLSGLSFGDKVLITTKK